MKKKNKSNTVYQLQILYDNVFFMFYVVVITLVAVKFGWWFYALLLFTPEIARFQEIDSTKKRTDRIYQNVNSSLFDLHQTYLTPEVLENLFKLLKKNNEKIFLYDNLFQKYVYVCAVTRNKEGEVGFITNDVNDESSDESVNWKFVKLESDRYTVYQRINGKKGK